MATSTKKPKVERSAGRGLKVRSFQPSFWRCGRPFSREAVVIPLDELTDSEIDILVNEPALACEQVALQVAEEAAKPT